MSHGGRASADIGKTPSELFERIDDQLARLRREVVRRIPILVSRHEGSLLAQRTGHEQCDQQRSSNGGVAGIGRDSEATDGAAIQPET